MRVNIFANFLGQAFSALAIIIALPFYSRIFDEESFGLITLYILLNGWIFILSSGLTPVLGRQMAIYKAGSLLGTENAFRVQRSMEAIFLLMTIATIVAFFVSRRWIVENWLNFSEINNFENIIVLLGLSLATRWGVALYSSGLAGLEMQVWLNKFNSLLITLRWFSIIALSIFFHLNLIHFFIFQVVIGTIELAVISIYFYKKSKSLYCLKLSTMRFYYHDFKPILPFTLATLYTASLWSFIFQYDKIIASSFLTISDYGYFGFAALLSNLTMRVAQPINQAALPRLTAAISRNNKNEYKKLLHLSGELASALTFSTAITILIFPMELLLIVSGNQKLAEFGAPVLLWMVLANSILSISGLLYNLQSAHGKMSMHVINLSSTFALQVPMVSILLFREGLVAMLMGLFVLRVITFLIFSPLVFKRIQEENFLSWLFGTIGLPLFGSIIGGILVLLFGPEMEVLISKSERIQGALLLTLSFSTIFIFSIIFAPRLRTLVMNITFR